MDYRKVWEDTKFLSKYENRQGGLPVRFGAVKDHLELVQVVWKVNSKVWVLVECSKGQDVTPGTIWQPAWRRVRQFLRFLRSTGQQVSPLVLLQSLDELMTQCCLLDSYSVSYCWCWNVSTGTQFKRGALKFFQIFGWLPLTAIATTLIVCFNGMTTYTNTTSFVGRPVHALSNLHNVVSRHCLATVD